MVGTGSTSAQSTATIGQLHFSEVSISQRLVETRNEILESKENLVDITIDEIPAHSVDEEAEELHLSSTASENVIDTFEEENFVTNTHTSNESYKSLPVTDLGGKISEWIVTGITYDYRPLSGVLTSDGYQSRDIQISSEGNDILVSLDDTTYRTPPKTEETHQFDPEPVSLLVEKSTGETKSVLDQPSGETVQVPVIEELSVSVSVYPTVTVRNYGELNAVAHSTDL